MSDLGFQRKVVLKLTGKLVQAVDEGEAVSTEATLIHLTTLWCQLVVFIGSPSGPGGSGRVRVRA